MSWISFLEDHGFELQKPPALRDVGVVGDMGLVGAELWHRGDLRLVMTRHEIGWESSWTEARLMKADDPPFEPIGTIANRIGVEGWPGAHDFDLFVRYFDQILTYYVYKFLLDRGFTVQTNDHRGAGRFTLVLKRGDLVARMEMNGDEEHVDFNGMSLADVYRTLDIDAHRFADLRKHIDVILAWLDSTEAVIVRG